MNLFSRCLTTGLCVSALAAMTACSSDDDWKDVDGGTPQLSLTSVHEMTEAGRTIKIAGTVTDNDGISSIDQHSTLTSESISSRSTESPLRSMTLIMISRFRRMNREMISSLMSSLPI